VTIFCLDPGTVDQVDIRQFDGDHWEDNFEQSGISECSKDSN
jgi:hypothetical protein